MYESPNAQWYNIHIFIIDYSNQLFFFYNNALTEINSKKLFWLEISKKEQYPSLARSSILFDPNNFYQFYYNLIKETYIYICIQWRTQGMGRCVGLLHHFLFAHPFPSVHPKLLGLYTNTIYHIDYNDQLTMMTFRNASV